MSQPMQSPQQEYPTYSQASPGMWPRLPIHTSQPPGAQIAGQQGWPSSHGQPMDQSNPSAHFMHSPPVPEVKNISVEPLQQMKQLVQSQVGNTRPVPNTTSPGACALMSSQQQLYDPRLKKQQSTLQSPPPAANSDQLPKSGPNASNTMATVNKALASLDLEKLLKLVQENDDGPKQHPGMMLQQSLPAPPRPPPPIQPLYGQQMENVQQIPQQSNLGDSLSVGTPQANPGDKLAQPCMTISETKAIHSQTSQMTANSTSRPRTTEGLTTDTSDVVGEELRGLQFSEETKGDRIAQKCYSPSQNIAGSTSDGDDGEGSVAFSDEVHYPVKMPLSSRRLSFESNSSLITTTTTGSSCPHSEDFDDALIDEIVRSQPLAAKAEREKECVDDSDGDGKSDSLQGEETEKVYEVLHTIKQSADPKHDVSEVEVNNKVDDTCSNSSHGSKKSSISGKSAKAKKCTKLGKQTARRSSISSIEGSSNHKRKQKADLNLPSERWVIL